MEKAIQPKINRNAHSNVRRGLSDFNDGGALTHYFGNDDYKDGNNCPDPYADNQSFDGSAAFGNDLLKDDDTEETEDKNSSGQDVF